MTYMVHGQSVGNDPASIERGESYLEFFNRLGNSAEAIDFVEMEIRVRVASIGVRPHLF